MCFGSFPDFSVAVQAFSILAAMGYACAFVLFILYMLFEILHKSRPLVIGMSFIVFCIGLYKCLFIPIAPILRDDTDNPLTVLIEITCLT